MYNLYILNYIVVTDAHVHPIKSRNLLKKRNKITPFDKNK